MSNVAKMRKLYLTNSILQTASAKLGWSHYVELLKIDDPLERSFYHYYKCATAKKKRMECDLKPAKKAWLEDLVVSETVKLLQDDKIIDAVVSRVMEMQAKESEEMPLLEARLKETEESIDNLLKAIEMGVIAKSTKERLEALETEKAELESQIALEKLKQPTLTEEFVRYWLERFRGIDTTNIAHRKLLIDVFLNTVFLYNDKVVITFNYKEDTETVNFCDIEAALDSCACGSDFKFTSSPKQLLLRTRHPERQESLYSPFDTSRANI